MMHSRVNRTCSLCRVGNLFLLCALAVPFLVVGDHSIQSPSQHLSREKEDSPPTSLLVSRPLTFEENRGKMDEQVAFVARAGRYDLFLLKDKAQFSLRSSSDQGRHMHQLITMMPVGANPNATLEGQNKLAGTTNYFLGNDRSNWRKGISTFERARYREIYPGIDLVYYGSHQRVECDFIVAPGVDPFGISVVIDGPDHLELDGSGNLTMQIGLDTLVFEAPDIYQEIDGKRHTIAGAFAVLGERQFGFTMGTYDSGLPLVIDPVLTYATYLGGIGEERIGAITIDTDRNIYVVGSTSSADFPLTGPPVGVRGSVDILVAKISKDGTTLLYSTVLGGSRVDYGVDIAVDVDGNAYLCGTSSSYDDDQTAGIDESFPIVNGFQTSLAGDYGQDVVVAKLDRTGDLEYSSYLGANNDQDEAKAIAVDRWGYMYVTGTTSPSLDIPRFPIRNAFQPEAGSYGIDGFVTRIHTNAVGDASLVYSTYLGGQNTDTPSDIAVDSEGNAVIVGNTEAEDFPLVNAMFPSKRGATDAFVTHLGAAGSFAYYSTYIGGDGSDNAWRVAMDDDGFVYVAGNGSDGFPTTPGAYDETGYVGYGGPTLFKIDPDGTRLEFSTFLVPYGPALAIAVDEARNVNFATSYNRNAQWHQAVNRLDRTGARILFEDEITGLEFVNMGYYQSYAVDAHGNAYFAYSPTRADLPTITPIQPDLKGSSDLYIGRTGKDYVAITAINPHPTRNLWLPHTLRPGEERQFTLTVQYGLFASDRGTIRLTVEDDDGNELASQVIPNVPAGNDWLYDKRAMSKITVPAVEQSDSLFVRAYLTPDGHLQAIDTATIAYKIVVHQWTFMVYMDGDNDLEGAAMEDLEEMKAVGSSDSLAIVVLLDRHPGYFQSALGDWADARYIVLQPGGGEKIRRMGELNMGHPQTLVNFIYWVRQRFPAEHYALVLWDHGGGWMAQNAPVLNEEEPTPRFPVFPPGSEEGFEPYLDVGSDETNNDALYSIEIQRALRLLPKSDILWVSTCLNAMIENAFQYRHSADYYVASQDRQPARGWDNTSFFALIDEHPDMSPEEVARWIVQSYGPQYSPDRVNITQSAVAMSRVDEVVDEVDYLAGLLIEREPWAEVDSALAGTHWFPPDPYRDLYDFALNLKDESSDADIRLQCDRIMGTLYDCTVANYASLPEANAHGLSIFFPTCLAAYDVQYHEPGNIEFADKTLWDEFLIFYLLRKRLPPGVEGPVIDTYEINDSFSQAFGPLLPDQAYVSYIPYAGDRDFYFFTTGRSTSASIKLTSPRGINYDLQVMDASEQIIGSSSLDQEVDSVEIATLLPGTYYLEVVANGNFFDQPYRLDLAYEGSLMGQVPLSFDDGEPAGGYYSLVSGTVIGSSFRAPQYPMELSEVSFFIASTDGAGAGGDGSFYVWVADAYGTKTDPFKVTPSGLQLSAVDDSGSWFAVDLSEKDIALHGDFFVGIGYDGVNTPVLGVDSVDDGRGYFWDDSTDTWQGMPLTLFIRARASYLETPAQVTIALPEAVYGLPAAPITVPLLVSDLADVGIDSLELTVTYEPAVLALDSIAFDNTIGTDWLIGDVDTSLTGRVNIAVEAGTPITEDERLLNLHFVIQPGATVGDSSWIVLERVFVNGGQLVSSSRNASVIIGLPSHAEEESPILPQSFTLYQNYPNPFNPSTTLQFDVPHSSHVGITILDMLGRHVKTLVDAPHHAGQFRTVWDGTDERAMPIAAGIYFCRMEAGDFVRVVKLALVR